MIAVASGDVVAHLRAVGKLVQEDALNPWHWAERGTLLEQRGHRAAARACYCRARDLSEGDSDARAIAEAALERLTTPPRRSARRERER